MTQNTLSLPVETERLRLREFVDEDWVALHAYNNREEFYRYMLDPQTPESTKAFIERSRAARMRTPRVSHDLAIVWRPADQVIGAISLHVESWRYGLGTLAYAINPDFWGRGITPEAARKVLELGFRGLGLHRIVAHCDVEHVRSYRVMEKLGMTREGILRKHEPLHGEWRDNYLYAILEEEFSG